MASKFKLLMTTDTVSGIWNYSISLCEALMQHINIDILLISFGEKPTNIQIDEANKSGIRVIFTDLPVEWRDNCINEPSTLNGMKDYLKSTIDEFDPTLIHYNHYACSSMETNYPSILVSHGDVINWIKWVENKGKDVETPKYLFKYQKMVNQGLHNADIIVAPSRFIAECLIKTYDIKGKIKIINNGISFEPTAEFRNSPCLIMAGRLWDKAKNLDLLVKASTKMPDNIKILLAGEEPSGRLLPRKIEYLGNLSREELQQAYRRASIYIAASSYEPFGIPPVEAAFSNCAIVANDIPAFRELWGDCACLFERNNVNSLIRTINNLIENEPLLKLTAKNCQAKALSAFSSKRMALEYINLYKYLLQSKLPALRGQKTQSVSEEKIK